MRLLATAALLTLLLAGCAGEPGPSDGTPFPTDERPGQSDPTYEVYGVFHGSATPQQMRELGDKAEELGGTMRVMESYPPQFIASGLAAEPCDNLRAYAESRSYVHDVGSCRLSSSSSSSSSSSASS